MTLMNTQANLKQDALVIGLVGVAHGISHFFHMILAPLFPWLKQAFALSYAELGLLMSVFFIVSGIGQALAGFVVDKLGARTVLFFGIGCLALSALVLSGAQNYSMLLAGSMIASSARKTSLQWMWKTATWHSKSESKCPVCHKIKKGNA
jgi:FSR family fosmidomycin resistance protein-like MFS transporter